MRHRVAGRRLGRTTSHRLATLRNLSRALFEQDRIRTTLTKAKEVRPFAEKLITLSKKGGLHRRRLVARHLHDRPLVRKLFDTISARYMDRDGGYTRILKLGPRVGDGAEMAILEMVGLEAETEEKKGPAGKKQGGGTKRRSGGTKRKAAARGLSRKVRKKKS